MDDVQEQIRRLIAAATPETQSIISRIFVIEKDKLYMSNPYGIVEHVEKAIREAVR
jgi:hypothetical protein